MAFLLNGNKSADLVDLAKILFPKYPNNNLTPSGFIEIEGYLPNSCAEPEKIEILIAKSSNEKNEFVVKITTEKMKLSKILIGCLKSKILVNLKNFF